MLTLALNRGRILKECLPLLKNVGIQPLEDISKSRKLCFATNQSDVQILVTRGSDVPTYVHYGAADIGITGKDTLLEYGEGTEFYERLDLGIARCRLMTAAPVGWQYDGRPIRVATKYVKVARDYFARVGQQVTIISLSGAMEIAPSMGLADIIVDIVDTGNTLKANGLVAIETITDISTRVIVNRAAMKLKFDQIQQLLEQLQGRLG